MCGVVAADRRVERALASGPRLALALGRARGAGLVVPRRPQLDVVAVAADAVLALRTRSHRRRLLRVISRRRIIQGPMVAPAADCLFCRIVARTTPADIEYEDDAVLAFRDIYPKAPVHLLIIPKRHIDSIMAMQPGDAEIAGSWLRAARSTGEVMGLAERGYRLSVHCGPEGGQHVYHIHVHFLAGRRAGG